MKYITEHYVFIYEDKTLAAKDIEQIARKQEDCFDKICSTLKVKYPDKIYYYLLDSPEEVGKLYGDNEPINGFAVWGENKIYATYNENIKCIGPHEDAHLISFVINAPKSDFIVEGLAMYFDEKWWDLDNFIWAAYYKNTNHELSISKLFENSNFNEYNCEITYPIAGAFTKFLIDTYGIEKYLLLYKYNGVDYSKIFNDVFNFSISQLEKAFWNKIKTIKFDIEIIEKILKYSILGETYEN